MSLTRNQELAVGQMLQGDGYERVLFGCMRRYQRDRAQVTVDALMAKAGEALGAGESVPRGAVVDFFKALDAKGFGQFVVGRRGRSSRFVFSSVSMKAIASYACQHDETAGDAEEEAAGGACESGELLSHTFNLRPGLSIDFCLPADLKKNEADRLARFIHTLPFDSEVDDEG